MAPEHRDEFPSPPGDASGGPARSSKTTSRFAPNVTLPPPVADWLGRAKGLQKSAPLGRKWGVFADGIRLLGEFQIDAPAQRPLMAELEDLAAHYVVPEVVKDPAAVAREADSLISTLEQQFFQLAGDATLDNAVAVQRIEPMLAQLEALRPVLTALANEPWDPFQDLLVQIEGIERELQRRKAAAKKGEQVFEAELESVENIRIEAMTAQVAALVAEAAQSLDREIPPAADLALAAAFFWSLAERGEGLLTQLFDDGQANVELATQLTALQSLVERCAEHTAAIVGKMSDETREIWVTDHLAPLQDWASEVLTEAEDWSVKAASYGFDRARTRINQFIAMCPDPKARELKELRSRERKLRNEWVEKTVAMRIEKNFGFRFAWFLENSILVLIIVVCALLGVEWFATDLSEGEKFALMVADTFICAAFLFEFFFKLALAPLRGNYFKRHWFFDLLPSLPISLGLYMLEAAEPAMEAAEAAHAHDGPGAENVTALRAARFARLPRLARYVRIARPAIRLLRVFLFALRGMDRLARRYGALLNRDIVFFEPPTTRDAKGRVTERVGLLRRQLRQRKREIDQQLDPEQARAAFQRALEHTHEQSRLVAGMVRGVELPDLVGEDVAAAKALRSQTMMRRSREIRVEQVIEALVNADADSIEESFGPDFPRQVAKIVRVAGIPPLCWLPGVNDIARARREASDDSDLAARVARAIGLRLQKVNNSILWFADLNGIITPAQLVDRIGTTIVNSTKRPATRLVTFGAVAITVLLLIQLLPGETFLDKMAKNIQSGVAQPILIVGGLAMGLLFFGRWLQRIASSATEFYARAAEAQFVALLRDAKQARAVADLALIDRRVLRPEALAQGLADDTGASASTTEIVGSAESATATAPAADSTAAASATSTEARRSVSDMLNAPRLFRRALKSTFGGDAATAGSLPERVYLLYRDYLSGSPMHRSDNRTTNQLLGNLSMQEIVNRILKVPAKAQKKLDALDLDRAQAAIFGPGLWFNFITLAIAQRTAQLVVDYNQHVIPDNELHTRPRDEQARYEWWLNRKRIDRRRFDPELSVGQREAAAKSMKPEPPPQGPSTSYSTTVFTALDFLTTDTTRIHAIEARFGKEVAENVQHDRRRLICDVFATIPAYAKPRIERSINPNDLYWKYIGGGRLLWRLPFSIGWALGKGVVRLVVWFWRTLRELLNPTLKPVDNMPAPPSFDVALRKIMRMRKPVFLAAAYLRAQMDVEYLGHLLPGETESGLEGEGVFDDLSQVGAAELERDPFRKIYDERREALQEFTKYLSARGLTEDGLSDRLAQISPEFAKRRREVLRALTSAYVTDFSGLRSLVNAKPVLDSAIDGAIAAKGRLPNKGAFGHAMVVAGRIAWEPIRLLLGSGVAKRRKFARWWENHVERTKAEGGDPARISPAAKRHVFSWWLGNVQKMQYYVEVAHGQPKCDTEQAIERILENTIGNPSAWTEHLVTLRTIQTLTMLDILSDRRLVRSLGEFTDTDEPAVPVIVPTL